MSSLWIPAPASASQTPKASVNPISSTEQRSDTGFRCRPVICPHCFPSFVASEINVASSGKSQPARPARETQGSSTRRVCPQGRGSQEPPFTHSLPSAPSGVWVMFPVRDTSLESTNCQNADSWAQMTSGAQSSAFRKSAWS